MWSDERVATLKKLWLEGLSASEVARQLGGVTRNAVIGKIHRLGLSGRAGTPTLRVRRRAVRPLRNRPTARPPCPAPMRREPVAPEDPGLVASLDQLRPRQCRWPIGDPSLPDFSFCGAAAPDGAPYCPHHGQRAYRPGTALRADRSLRRMLLKLAA